MWNQAIYLTDVPVSKKKENIFTRKETLMVTCWVPIIVVLAHGPSVETVIE